jgi:hypothetical protein
MLPKYGSPLFCLLFTTGLQRCLGSIKRMAVHQIHVVGLGHRHRQ